MVGLVTMVTSVTLVILIRPVSVKSVKQWQPWCCNRETKQEVDSLPTLHQRSTNWRLNKVCQLGVHNFGSLQGSKPRFKISFKVVKKHLQLSLGVFKGSIILLDLTLGPFEPQPLAYFPNEPVLRKPWVLQSRKSAGLQMLNE